MLETLSKLWWVFLIRGILAVLFAILAFTTPGLTLAMLVLFFATYALVDGAFTIYKALTNWSEADHHWLLLLEGIMGIIVGCLTWMAPAITAYGLLIYIAMWSIVTGAFRIATAFRLRHEIDGEWLLALSGAISIAFGFMLVTNPGSGALGLLWLIATFSVVFGFLLIMLAFKVRGAARNIRATPGNFKARSAGQSR